MTITVYLTRDAIGFGFSQLARDFDHIAIVYITLYWNPRFLLGVVGMTLEAHPPLPSQDTASLVRRLAGPSTTKAGQVVQQSPVTPIQNLTPHTG